VLSAVTVTIVEHGLPGPPQLVVVELAGRVGSGVTVKHGLFGPPQAVVFEVVTLSLFVVVVVEDVVDDDEEEDELDEEEEELDEEEELEKVEEEKEVDDEENVDVEDAVLVELAGVPPQGGETTVVITVVAGLQPLRPSLHLEDDGFILNAFFKLFSFWSSSELSEGDDFTCGSEELDNFTLLSSNSGMLNSS
jgi:hypothetical protein